MTIDWQKEALNYREAYLADLKTLIAIDSERDEAHKTAEYPLGPGPAKALQAFLDIAQRDGFKTKNLDNLVGYVEYGSGEETFAVLGHADVMPAGDGWRTDPFTLTIEGDRAYGRGTSDDKGPALAAYYGLKMLKDHGLVPNKTVRFIIGTDEESNWAGMTHYLELEKTPDLGFSPDAEFPLINGEKGNVTFEVHLGGENAGDFSLKAFESGLRTNMVPRDATATVTAVDNEAIATDFTAFLDAAPVTGDVMVDGDGVHLHIIGKAAHGMEPKNGINGGTYLASFLNQYAFGADAAAFLKLVGTDLHDDSRAYHLGLNVTDEVMGDLTMNVGIMQFRAGQTSVVNTNFRYPKGVTSDQIEHALLKATKKMTATVEKGREMVPHYVDPSDPIVATLMQIYREQTGDDAAQPEVVGGGTYGRLMPRGVAFGALFPGTPDTMHQVDEFQPVSDLLKALGIYGQSIYELTK